MERITEKKPTILQYGTYEYGEKSLEYRLRNCILQLGGIQSFIQEEKKYCTTLKHDLYRARQTIHNYQEIEHFIEVSNNKLIEKQKEQNALLSEITSIRSALGRERFYSFVGQIANFEPELNLVCTNVLMELHKLDEAQEEQTTESELND